MKFSYNWLKDYFSSLPDPKEVADLFINHSFEVEEVKKERNDAVLDVAILSNRADCFSHLGLARELSAILKRKLIYPNIKKLLKSEDKSSNFKIKVENSDFCPRYSAILIKDVEVKKSPKFIQERLRACGLQPVNNIVDATNYVMLEIGQPLHAFDFDKIKGTTKTIFVRKAKKGEKITLLDNKNYILTPEILLIADSEGPLGIAGIKGGKRAEISRKTRTILIESANFNPVTIRKGSQKLKLRTDASLRFEHGLDPNLTLSALERLSFLLLEVAGGKIIDFIDFYPKPLKPWRIKLVFEKAEKLTGLKIPKKKIVGILEDLGLKTIKKTKNFVLIEVPTFRQDLRIPEDLIEEVVRIYGLEKIPATPPLIYSKAVDRNKNLYWQDRIRDFLKLLKFSEVFTYSFISQKQKEFYKYTDHLLVELENPLSSEYQYLRPSLIPNLLEAVKKNFRYFDRFQIFEIGKIFKPDRKKVKEESVLGLVLADKNKRMEVEDFRLFKGLVEAFLQELGITDYLFDETAPLIEERVIFWHPQRLASIKIGEERVGLIGEVHPFLIKDFSLKGTIMIAEFNLEKLIKKAREEQNFQPISPYPSALRDISVLVPLKTRIEEVIREINKLGGRLVRDVDLFDLYRGENIPEGRQSLAFRIVFQAEDRTLTSEEIDRLMKKIIEGLEKNKNWQVRKKYL